MAAKAKLIQFLAAGLEDTNGNPLSGYKIRTYATDGTTAKVVWEDRDKTLPSGAGKSAFTLDTTGRAVVYGDGVYVIKVWTAAADPDTDSPYKTYSGVEARSGFGRNTETVETIAALRLLTGNDDITSVQPLGYYTPGDGGGGPVRIWDAASTATDNGGSVIRPTAVAVGSPGRWIWDYSGPINVRWYGANGDDSADDFAPVQAAINSLGARGGTIFFPYGQYRISQPLILPESGTAGYLAPIWFEGESSEIHLLAASRIIYTADSGSLFEGRGAGGAGTSRFTGGFKDLALRGTYFKGIDETPTSRGINVYNAAGLKLIRTHIRGFKYGLYTEGHFYYSQLEGGSIRNCDVGWKHPAGAINNTTVSRMSFSDFTSYAVDLENWSESVVFSGVWFEMAGIDQVKLSYGRLASFENCYWEYGAGYAVKLLRTNENGHASQLNLQGGSVNATASNAADAIIYVDNSATAVPIDVKVKGAYASINAAASPAAFVRSNNALTTATVDVSYQQIAGYKTLSRVGGSIIDTATTSGTWTPTITTGTPGDLSVTYTTQSGAWQRVGDTIFAWGNITTATFTYTTASGLVLISGLPVASVSPGLNSIGTINWSGVTLPAGYTDLAIQNAAGSAQMTIRRSGSATATAGMQATEIPSGGTLILNFFISYKIR